MTFELETEDPGVCSVDEAETQALARAHGEGVGQAAVNRDGVADAPRPAGFHHAAEVPADGGICQEPPIIENLGNFAVDNDRYGLFDDPRTLETAADLLYAAMVRGVPEGAGIRTLELIMEGFARRERLLRPMRD